MEDENAPEVNWAPVIEKQSLFRRLGLEELDKNAISPEGLTTVIKRVGQAETTFGTKLILDVTQGALWLNWTSQQKLEDAWGSDTASWEKMNVKIVKNRQSVKGIMRDVLMVEPA